MINLILEFSTNSNLSFDLQEFFEEIKYWGFSDFIVAEYSYVIGKETKQTNFFNFTLNCQEKTSVWKFVKDIENWKGWEINNVTINSISS